MVFYEKEVIDHVLGNHKGARDHLVSWYLFTLNELKGKMLIAFRVKTTYLLAKKLPSFVFVVVHYTLWPPAVHTKTIVNANVSKRIFLSPSTRRRSSFT